MFGKNKKITASDILKMIAELPEDEQESVKSMLNGGVEEVDESAEEAVVEETTESETEAETEEDAAEQEEDPAEDPVEETADPQEDTPSDVPAEEPASDVEEAGEEAAEEVAEETAPATDARDIYAEFDALKESFAALVQRIDSMTATQGGDSDEDIGMPFGPDITDAEKNEDDELERARRAAFGF